MAKLELTLPEDVTSKFNMRATDFAVDAVALFNWALHEAAEGRQVLSCASDGTDPVPVTLYSLDRVREQAAKHRSPCLAKRRSLTALDSDAMP